MFSDRETRVLCQDHSKVTEQPRRSAEAEAGGTAPAAFPAGPGPAGPHSPSPPPRRPLRPRAASTPVEETWEKE